MKHMLRFKADSVIELALSRHLSKIPLLGLELR